MKEQSEIIRNNLAFIQSFINEDKNAIYAYLISENSKEIVSDFLATASVDQALQVLNQYLIIEKWALKKQETVETTFLIEYQDKLLTKIKAQELDETQKKCLVDYHKNIESHMDFLGEGIVNELPNWREMLSNLQLSAKLLRPKAKTVLMQEYENQAQRLANLLKNKMGSQEEHLKKLAVLESLGVQKAMTTLSAHYKSVARSHYINPKFTKSERENALRKLAETRKEALYELAAHLIKDGERLLRFSKTPKVEEGLKILNDIKNVDPRAYFELALYYESPTAEIDYYLSLHYFYMYARTNKDEINRIHAYTGITNSKGSNVLARIYLGLLEPLEGELQDYYGSQHLKNAVNYSKDRFAEYAWDLSSDEDLSYEQQFKLLQLVEDLGSLPKLSAQSLAEINKRLHKSSIDSYEKEKMIRCAKILKPILVANFAVMLIDDRDVSLNIRQAWILLAWQRLTKTNAFANKPLLDNVQIHFNKIPSAQRQKLAKELQVTLPEEKVVAQPPKVVFFKPAAPVAETVVRAPEGEPPITYPELPEGDFEMIGQDEKKVAQFG